MVQRFAKISTTLTTADGHFGMLMHTYVFPTTDMLKTAMKVVPSFPLWVAFASSGSAAWGSQAAYSNAGAAALMVMKLYIAAGDANKPLSDYYGFPTPRGKPFMHSAGKN